MCGSYVQYVLLQIQFNHDEDTPEVQLHGAARMGPDLHHAVYPRRVLRGVFRCNYKLERTDKESKSCPVVTKKLSLTKNRAHLGRSGRSIHTLAHRRGSIAHVGSRVRGVAGARANARRVGVRGGSAGRRRRR